MKIWLISGLGVKAEEGGKSEHDVHKELLKGKKAARQLPLTDEEIEDGLERIVEAVTALEATEEQEALDAAMAQALEESGGEEDLSDGADGS